MATSRSKPSSTTAKSNTPRKASGGGSAKRRRARGEVTFPAIAGKRASRAAASRWGGAGGAAGAVGFASGNGGLLVFRVVHARARHDWRLGRVRRRGRPVQRG